MRRPVRTHLGGRGSNRVRGPSRKVTPFGLTIPNVPSVLPAGFEPATDPVYKTGALAAELREGEKSQRMPSDIISSSFHFAGYRIDPGSCPSRGQSRSLPVDFTRRERDHSTRRKTDFRPDRFYSENPFPESSFRPLPEAMSQLFPLATGQQGGAGDMTSGNGAESSTAK